ncbi:hypothetical protein GOP47_0001015 [Adiantum capillus-veneris]|uniref:Uncharacterized protein n=1 Tax=Adiantum capillus-veneris TaxID=13818 RepID=A0A9D4VFT9_ADICA|nr:hypothetical protein GOP47_0001013 [Adiantum capillus-veneris]KAI5084846.1 hypothetical protein GOP47_0001015 [Adiantum capillus-veneris]
MGVGCNNNRVYSITLNASNLAGTISPSLANCTLLETLDISLNHLEGPIPPNIGNLSYLVSMNLSKNHPDGNIPVELSMCVYLNAIDLHANQFSGPIPGQIGLLQRLKFFDVSNNKLFGAISPTLSNTSTGGPRFKMSSFKGNSDLYGYPLSVEPTGGAFNCGHRGDRPREWIGEFDCDLRCCMCGYVSRSKDLQHKKGRYLSLWPKHDEGAHFLHNALAALCFISPLHLHIKLQHGWGSMRERLLTFVNGGFLFQCPL